MVLLFILLRTDKGGKKLTVCRRQGTLRLPTNNQGSHVTEMVGRAGQKRSPLSHSPI